MSGPCAARTEAFGPMRIRYIPATNARYPVGIVLGEPS